MNQRFATVSVLLLMASVGSAQTTNASIYGSILDSSGASIAKARIASSAARFVFDAVGAGP